MSNCFLAGHGTCGGKITGEHYISETVLEAIGSSSVQIGGMPWQPTQTLQRFGLRSLVSNVLCEVHNSALSGLDKMAGDFFRAVDAADKRFEVLSTITTVDGLLVERWFLKVMCGLAAGVGFNNGTVPVQWRQALTGGPWPDGWGLYVPAPDGLLVLATEFYLETLVNPETKEVKGAKFRVAGVRFNLLLGQPDNPVAWGTYHPRGLIFRHETSEKKIEFTWPFDTDRAVVYTKVGSTTLRAPQWQDWNE